MTQSVLLRPLTISERKPTEADRFNARVASQRKWARRRRWLRLKARILGRRKSAQAAELPSGWVTRPARDATAL